MWPFNRLKVVQGVAGADRIALSDGGVVSIDEIMNTFSQIGKDIGVLTQACQRIEKKQLRWLELLNEREATLTPEKLAQLAGGMPPGGDHGQQDVGSELEVGQLEEL